MQATCRRDDGRCAFSVRFPQETWPLCGLERAPLHIRIVIIIADGRSYQGTPSNDADGLPTVVRAAPLGAHAVC